MQLELVNANGVPALCAIWASGTSAAQREVSRAFSKLSLSRLHRPAMLAHGALDAMIDALGADSNGHAAAASAAGGGDSARSSRRGSHRRHEKPADPLMSMDTLTLRHVAAAVGHLAQLPEAQHRLAEAGAVAKLVRLARSYPHHTPLLPLLTPHVTTRSRHRVAPTATSPLICARWLL